MEPTSSCCKRKCLSSSSTPPPSPPNKSPPTPPPIRSPEALRFVVSPIVLHADEALRAYRRNPQNVRLLPVQNRALTEEEAEARARMGEDILVSPYALHTNDFLESIKQFFRDFQDVDIRELRKLLRPSDVLYRDFLCVSWKYSETDMLSMVMYALDYYIKQEFLRKLSFYEGLLVPNVFQNSNGNVVRYIHILRESERLTCARALSSQEQHVLQACKDLLYYSERKLINVHGIRFSGRNVHNEMLNFLGSEIRALRMFGTHAFSSMLWEDFTKPLALQQLHDDLPRPKDDAFKLGIDLFALKAMLIRALVLSDLKDKYNKGELEEGYRFTQACGLAIIEKFMSKNVPYSFKVRFKTMSAMVLRESGREEDITMAHTFNLEDFATV